MLSQKAVLRFTDMHGRRSVPFAQVSEHDVLGLCRCSLQRFETVYPTCGSSNSRTLIIAELYASPL
jgi:hypothetical protein